MGYVDFERGKFERALETAQAFGFLDYVPHLRTIIEALRAIEALDKEYMGE